MRGGGSLRRGAILMYTITCEVCVHMKVAEIGGWGQSARGEGRSPVSTVTSFESMGHKHTNDVL